MVGVELDAAYAREAEGRLDRVIIADAAAFAAGPPPPEAPFDCLIAADVLEHLVDPWAALRGAAAMLAPGATAVVSLPNVLFWGVLARPSAAAAGRARSPGSSTGPTCAGSRPPTPSQLLEQAGFGQVEVHPRYWVEGAALRRRRRLARTPLRPYLAPQNILTAVKA